MKYLKQGLTGGMNQASDSTLLPDGDAKYLLNITLDEVGNWVSRPGSSAVGSAISGSDEGWGLFTYDSTDDTFTLIGISDRNVTALTEPDTWNDIATTQFPASTRVDATNFLNRLYMGSEDGATPVKYTTGGATTSLVPTLGGSQIITAKDSLVLQGNDIRPDIVFFSKPYTDQFYESTGTAASNADVNGAGTVVTTTAIFEPDDKGAVLYNSTEGKMAFITEWVSATIPYVKTDADTSTWDNDTVYVLRNRFKLDGAAQGVAAFQEYVVSFDQEKGYLWDPTSPTWSRVLPAPGCVNYRTVQVVDGKLGWMSRRGYYIFNGEKAPFDFSSKVKNKAKLTGVWDLIDYSEADKFCAGNDDESKIFLSVGTLKTKSGVFGSGVENAVFVIDLAREAWVLYSYPEQILAFTNFTNSDGEKELYGITSSAQVIKVEDTATSQDWGDVDIDVEVVTADHILGDPTVYHSVKSYKLRYTSSAEISIDDSVNKESYQVVDTVPISSSLNQVSRLPKKNRQGLTHSLRFTSTAPCSIEAYGFETVDETTDRKTRG